MSAATNAPSPTSGARSGETAARGTDAPRVERANPSSDTSNSRCRAAGVLYRKASGIEPAPTAVAQLPHQIAGRAVAAGHVPEGKPQPVAHFRQREIATVDHDHQQIGRGHPGQQRHPETHEPAPVEASAHGLEHDQQGDGRSDDHGTEFHPERERTGCTRECTAPDGGPSHRTVPRGDRHQVRQRQRQVVVGDAAVRQNVRDERDKSGSKESLGRPDSRREPKRG